MANNKIKFLRGTSNEYTAAEKDNDTIYFTTDDGKLYIGDKEVSGDGSITIDDALSDTSINPVQNKVINSALAGKAASSHNQASNTITAMTGYSKASSASAIAVGDSLNTAIGKLEKTLDSKLNTSLKGAANGLAELDSSGKVPSAQLPSYVDDVLEYTNKASFPATGESGKIYIAQDTNKTDRWSGSAYVEISPYLALGETSSTAYYGDKGKTAYDHSQADHAPSDAETFGDHVAIKVSHADGEVCSRCRMIKTDVGSDIAYPQLCARCAQIVRENYPESVETGLEA